MHVISLTRPSHFSVCNIEKLGIGPGNEANKMSILKRIYHKIQRKKGVLLLGFFMCARQKVTLLSKHILHRVHSTFNMLSSPPVLWTLGTLNYINNNNYGTNNFVLILHSYVDTTSIQKWQPGNTSSLCYMCWFQWDSQATGWRWSWHWLWLWRQGNQNM